MRLDVARALSLAVFLIVAALVGACQHRGNEQVATPQLHQAQQATVPLAQPPVDERQGFAPPCSSPPDRQTSGQRRFAAVHRRTNGGG